MEVTQVTPQKNNSNRFNIYIDGEFWAGVSANVLTEFNIYKGKEFQEDERLDEIFRKEIADKLYDRCVSKISRRPNSEREIRRYMKRVLYKKRRYWYKDSKYEGDYKKLEAEVADTVISQLKKLDLVDDLKFAEWWVENRYSNKPRSWHMIKNELYKKGVSRQVINKVKLSNNEELESAEKYFEKKLQDKGYDKQKIINRLKYKGFYWDTIKKILKKYRIE